MASLTETAYYARKIIKNGIILVIAFLIVKNSLTLGVNLIKKYAPKKEVEPTVDFGKLPPLVFPAGTEVSAMPTINLKLETIQGGLPTLAKITKVYFMPKRVNSYLTMERAKSKAKILGFENEPYQLHHEKDLTYTWENNQLIKSIFTMAITSQNFFYHYDFVNDQSLIQSSLVFNTEAAKEEAINFLREINLWPADLQGGEQKLVYYRFVPPDLTETSSLVETDFVRVNFFRKPLDEMPLMPAQTQKANITALVAKTGSRRVVEFTYNYFSVDTEVFGTYPLKDATEAWNELKNGQGYIANLGKNENGQITVRKAYLAYYDPPDEQSYLQPIFVFEGDRDFIAYVPAVKSEWIK